MNYLNQTIACVKRNNRFILLFLGTAILFLVEITSMEKTLLPQILSNPLLEGIPVEDIESELRSQRFVHFLYSLLLLVAKISYSAFVLYVGQFYLNELNNRKFLSWFKVAIYAEVLNLVYRLYMVIIQSLGLDIYTWNIKERFSLLNIVNTSDWGIASELLNSVMGSINVISILFFSIMVALTSVYFKIKVWKSLKYVLGTFVLISTVLLFLLSLIQFVNA